LHGKALDSWSFSHLVLNWSELVPQVLGFFFYFL
jgi:hypothetical protein